MSHGKLAERALGKPLPPDAEVHHVNGKREDNRPGNLVICPDRDYQALLHERTVNLGYYKRTIRHISPKGEGFYIDASDVLFPKHASLDRDSTVSVYDGWAGEYLFSFFSHKARISSNCELAELCGVPYWTAKGWRRHKRMPLWAYALIPKG